MKLEILKALCRFVHFINDRLTIAEGRKQSERLRETAVKSTVRKLLT